MASAAEAFESWSKLTIKARSSMMFNYYTLLVKHTDELAELVVEENGKNVSEAIASIAKGAEVVQYAASLGNLAGGSKMTVSRGITCEDVKEPLGVVGCVCPFNFPAMVPMWTIPIAITLGNTYVYLCLHAVRFRYHFVSHLRSLPMQSGA